MIPAVFWRGVFYHDIDKKSDIDLKYILSFPDCLPFAPFCSHFLPHARKTGAAGRVFRI